MRCLSRFLAFGLLSASANALCAAPADVTIQWTTGGIAHVTASDYRSLGYGQGYAFARDRACLLADHVITLRGERSRWYGADHPAVVGFMPTTSLNSDLFYRVQLADVSVAAAAAGLDKQVRELARGYADGFNRYVKEQSPQELQRLCPALPIPQLSELDVVRAMQSIGTIWKAVHVAPFAKASAWGGPPTQVHHVPPRDALPASLGSNVWAYGGDVTGNRGAIVVANPHTFWRGHWLSLHQMHLKIPGELEVAGAHFVGIPLPVAGFNSDVAWSIEAPATVSYFVMQRLDVQQGSAPTYLVDGKRNPITLRNIAIEVKQPNGSIARESFAIPYSALGPIYRLPEGPGGPAAWYAITDAGDGNAAGLNQLLHIAKARDVGAFVAGMNRSRGLGAHFVAGDRHGEVAYVEGGPLLDIADAALEDCRVRIAGMPFNFLDGTRSACSIRTPKGAPRQLQATSFPLLRGRGVIQNTNGSYRHSMFGRDVQGYSRLLGDPRAEPFNLRLWMSERRMQEITADGSVSDSEALAVIFDNRNYAAESWLDSLLAVACKDNGAHGNACAVLGSWDRRQDSASRGTLLFGEFWKQLGPTQTLFAAVDANKPFAVRPLAASPGTSARITSALGAAVAQLSKIGLTGAEPWGQILAAPSSKGRIPMHGGSDEMGVLNAIAGRALGRNGYEGIHVGTDYVHRVQWKDGVLFAETLLAHGQSDDPQSAHFDDQLEKFSHKQLAAFPFTAKQIGDDPQLSTLRLRTDSR